MCEVCGCGDPARLPVEVHERLLAGNDRSAAHNRAHFRARGVLAINVMGSPGAGKTALLAATARALGGARPIAAITGDLATDRDAQRLRAAGIPCTAITTGSACHLDADMVHRALHRQPDRPGGHDHGAMDGAVPASVGSILFIENVGNLVCPAIYDLGQAASVVALSVTEGEDKPLKYPTMFRAADLVLLTKIDLLPALPEFDRAALDDALARVMPAPRLIALSARSGTGLDEWSAWLAGLRARTAGDALPHPPPG